MSVSLKYMVDGRTVSQRDFFSGIEGEIRRGVIAEVTQQVEQTHCPKHGK